MKKIYQLSLFLENKPGHLLNACRTLAQAGLNVEAMSLADTEQFGILRILVRDWEQARKVCEARGTIIRLTEVLVAQTSNKPGGLADLLEVLADNGLNLEYMYSIESIKTDDALLVLRFDDPDQAAELLQKNGVRLLDGDELFTHDK